MTQTHPLPPDTDAVLLVGTAKGLFRFRRAADADWTFDAHLLPGLEVLQAWLDPRDPARGYAATDHAVWGSHLYRSDDHGRQWTAVEGQPRHATPRNGSTLRQLWSLAPGGAEAPDRIYAGIDPAGLFVSEDRGDTWRPLDGLNAHPSAGTWEPSCGGFAVHSVQADPRVPGRLFAAVSAGGAYRSDDGGETWTPINAGVVAPNLPPGDHVTGHNIHRLWRHPAARDRLYRQCYGGVYRSDDAGETWIDIGAGLPSGFGYALCGEPDDPDSVFVVPVEGHHLRTVPEGRLRVYRSRDAGHSWQALHAGLPQALCYVSVLRQALDGDGRRPMRLALGTTGGHLFASDDAGEHWRPLSLYLPRILSVSLWSRP